LLSLQAYRTAQLLRVIAAIWHDSNDAKLNPGMITLNATFPAATQTLLAPFLHPRSAFPMVLYCIHHYVPMYSNIA
jgi:hypothetical protein